MGGAMEKKRIYEIAKEEGLPSSLVLQRLQRAGIPVKTASSTVNVAEALHALNPNRHPKLETPPEPVADKPKAAAKAKPAAAKGVYLKRISVSSTMGPGVQADQSSLSA